MLVSVWVKVTILLLSAFCCSIKTRHFYIHQSLSVTRLNFDACKLREGNKNNRCRQHSSRIFFPRHTFDCVLNIVNTFRPYKVTRDTSWAVMMIMMSRAETHQRFIVRFHMLIRKEHDGWLLSSSQMNTKFGDMNYFWIYMHDYLFVLFPVNTRAICLLTKTNFIIRDQSERFPTWLRRMHLLSSKWQNKREALGNSIALNVWFLSGTLIRHDMFEAKLRCISTHLLSICRNVFVFAWIFPLITFTDKFISRLCKYMKFLFTKITVRTTGMKRNKGKRI